MDPGHFLSNIKWVFICLRYWECHELLYICLVRTTLESFWALSVPTHDVQ